MKSTRDMEEDVIEMPGFTNIRMITIKIGIKVFLGINNIFKGLLII